MAVRDLNRVSLNHPRGICIDSTDTVYVTNGSHLVSAFNTHGKFLKCFGKLGSGSGELYYPAGLAIDSTTASIFVCDYDNDRIVVY